MSFYITPTRRLRYVRAGGCFMLAIAISSMIFAAKDAFGVVFAVALAVICLLFGFLNLRWARQTPASSTVAKIPSLAPVSLQIRYYRRLFWFLAIGTPIASGWIAYDLYQLETGAVKQIELRFIACSAPHFGPQIT